MKFPILKNVQGQFSNMNVFNILVTLVAILELLKLTPSVPADFIPWIVFGIGVINIVLRTWFSRGTPIETSFK